MDKIILNGIEVEYDISFKKNKNTYFYFKGDGYIKINASRFQTESQIKKYMIKNASVFLKKIEKSKLKKQVVDPNKYILWGQTYTKTTSQDVAVVTIKEDMVLEPIVPVDQLNKLYVNFEKELFLSYLQELAHKYKNNPFVNIDNMTIKTRYTKTRFGSCNAVKRNINMNTNLVHYDKVFTEYVFLHEISHLTHQNHGPKFYKLLESLCPDYYRIRKELKNSFRR